MNACCDLPPVAKNQVHLRATRTKSTSDAAVVAVPQVKPNAVAFASHMLLPTIVMLVQISWCNGGRRGKRHERVLQSEPGGNELITFKGDEDEIYFDNGVISGGNESFIGGNLCSINIEEEQEDEDNNW